MNINGLRDMRVKYIECHEYNEMKFFYEMLTKKDQLIPLSGAIIKM
jgi:hypothetical protein